MMADDKKKGKKDEPEDTRTYEQKIADLDKESMDLFNKLSKDLDPKIGKGRILDPENDLADKFVDRSLWEYR